MRSAVFIIGSLFVLGGCSILSPKPAGNAGTGGGGGGGSGGGGGGGGTSGKGWSEIFAEAPSYKLGELVEIKAPPCSGDAFIKLEIEQDKPFHFTTKSPAAGNSCAYVEVVNGNAQTANTPGSSTEVCGESKTIESKGQPGGTYIAIQEKYGCAGIAVSLAIAEGPAGAAAAPTGAAPTSDGPKPEN